MTSNEPIINKSCGFIPNHVSLVSFAVLKIAVDIIASVVLGYVTLLIIALMSDLIAIWFLIIMFGIIMDIPFMTVLIVGASKKCHHLFKISFYYSIISLVTALTCTIVSSVYFEQKYIIYNSDLSDNENFLIHIAIISTYTLIHIYMILLMKSEITRTANTDYVYDKQENVANINVTGTSKYDRFL